MNIHLIIEDCKNLMINYFMKMKIISDFRRKCGINSSDVQPCVRAINTAKIPLKLRRELNLFVGRNKITDCGKVAPNCLKAHMIKTASEIGLKKEKIKKLKELFKSRIGYKGHYLDKGKLRRI